MRYTHFSKCNNEICQKNIHLEKANYLLNGFKVEKNPKCKLKIPQDRKTPVQYNLLSIE